MSSLYNIPLYDYFQNLRNNIPSYDYFRYLRNGVRYDETLIIEWIVQNNDIITQNINNGNKYGFTALHYAVEHRLIKLVKLLIKHNADVDIKDAYGNTPLNDLTTNQFMRKQDTDILKMLIKAGADVNNIANNRVSPLLNVIWIGKIDIVKLLIKNGADVNMKDDKLLIMKGDKLIKAGGNVNMKDDKGLTALDYAIKFNDDIDNRYIKISKLLLDAHMF